MKKRTKKKQTKRGLLQDQKLRAKKPGKRRSKSGKYYTETRENRSDKDRRKRL